MRYVCLDIKATGNSRRDRPWEIAAVAFDTKFQATDSLFLQINPEIELSPQAEHDFGVTNENRSENSSACRLSDTEDSQVFESPTDSTVEPRMLSGTWSRFGL